MLEPWGFHNAEYYFSALMAQMINVQQPKRSKMLKPSVFARDMYKLVMQAIRKDKPEEGVPDIDLETAEGRKAMSDYAVKSLKAMFGNRVVDKRNNT